MASEAEFFEVRVDDAALVAGLDELIRRMGDLTPVMQEIGQNCEFLKTLLRTK